MEEKASSEMLLTLLLTSILAFGIQTVKAEHEVSITIGTTDFVESGLDPAQAYDYFGWDIIRNIGCGLVDIRPGSTAGSEDIIPSLATDWSISADGLEWTFNLRQGVEFDDGTEFNATHVKYSFDRGISLAAPDGPFVGIGYGDILDSVEATSRYQVKFHLKIQFSPFLSLMANSPSFIVNPSYAPLDRTVDYVDGNARASSPMDLGPYILTKWVRSAGKDMEMKLDANPQYWNISGGYPRIGSVVINFYSNSTALRQAVESGEVAAVLRKLEIQDILDLKANPNLRAWEGPGGLIQYIVFQEKIAPFNDSRVRRAVGASINRTTLVSTVFLGQAIPLYSTIPNEMATHAEAFELLGDANYTYARAVLGELGYSETNKLVIELWYETSGHYPQSAEQVVALKDSLEASGVMEAHLNGLDWVEYRAKRNEETMPAYIYGWYPDYVDPDDYVYPLLHSSGSSWLHHNYANPQMDTLVENARATTDAAERNQLYTEIQSLMVEDCPIVPVFQSKAWAVARPDINGIYLDITQSQRLWLLQKMLPMIPATVNISPDALNLRSEGKWITACIQLPEGYDAEDIDAPTILLNGTISPVLNPKYDFVTNSSAYLVDHDSDGIMERMVKFDRVAVESFIVSQGISNGNVTLTITGRLFDGTMLEGTDTILVSSGGPDGRRR